MTQNRGWRFYNRRFLVDALQLRLVGVAITHFLLAVLILSIVLFAPIIIKLEGGDLAAPTVQDAAHDFLVLHNRLWAPLLGAFVLLVLHNIVVTHRIVGPLARFRRYLRSVGDGDLSGPIRVRRKDYLRREVQATNDMVAALRSKVDRLQEQLEQTSAAWAALKQELDERDSGLQSHIETVSDHFAGCRASVAAFKTRNELTPEAKTKESSRVSLQPIGLKS